MKIEIKINIEFLFSCFTSTSNSKYHDVVLDVILM